MDKEFKTNNIILAATLRLLDHQMIRIEIIGSRGEFVFDDVSDEFLNQYDLGRCLVEPQAFNNMVKQLTTSVRRMTQ